MTATTQTWLICNKLRLVWLFQRLCRGFRHKHRNYKKTMASEFAKKYLV